MTPCMQPQLVEVVWIRGTPWGDGAAPQVLAFTRVARDHLTAASGIRPREILVALYIVN